MKKLFLSKTAAALVFSALATPFTHAANDEFWRTDGATGGSWTSANWNLDSANAAGGTGWIGGNNANFTANSTLSFASSTVGNVSVAPGCAVTITAGVSTLDLGGLVSTFDIGAGATLTWQSQTLVASSAAGITKNGAGVLDLGSLTWATSMTGGFTLNEGTVIVTGKKALGNGALNLNGGTLQSTSGLAFTPTSLTIGGNFALAGTGNTYWDAASTIALGSSSRTITNNTTSGSRQFRGLISGAPGAGLTFSGTGAAQIYIGNSANSFDGPIAINGGEVVFNDNGSLGASTSITLDGGRLTLASMATSGNTSALTAATIAANRNIFVGASAGTSLSVQGATGVTTYNGVIADKAGAIGSWAKQGAGMLKLGGASSYSGNTAINNGTVQLNAGSNRLPISTVVSLGQVASTNLGTLDLNGLDQEIAGLVSTTGTNASALVKNTLLSSSPATLTLSGASSYSFGDGTPANSGAIVGAVSLLKKGSGTQILGDTNSYTGTTTVIGGRLIVSGSLTSTTLLAPSGGAVELGRDNAIVNTARASMGGGVLATANHMASFADLTLTSDSLIDLGAGSTASVLRFGDSHSLVWSGALSIANWSGNSLGGDGDKVFFGSSQDGLSIAQIEEITFLNPTINGEVQTGSFSASILSTGEVVAAVPEPGARVMLLAGIGTLGFWRWMRRRNA